MKLEYDFNVEEEAISLTLIPQTNAERIVCGAIYKSKHFEETIGDDSVYTLIFTFVEKDD